MDPLRPIGKLFAKIERLVLFHEKTSNNVLSLFKDEKLKYLILSYLKNRSLASMNPAMAPNPKTDMLICYH